MRGKKLITELSVIIIIWLIAVNLGEIMATIASLMFIVAYIVVMIDAMREKNTKTKAIALVALMIRCLV